MKQTTATTAWNSQIQKNSKITDLIDQGAIFYCSHSGGKDSQAMYALLTNLVPADQLVLVHADLGEVEWTGVIEHIENTTHHPLNVVTAIWKDGSIKNLLTMVEKRFEKRPEVPSWPDPVLRTCTSDLKRDPIHKFMKADMKKRGVTLGLNCTGLRADESTARKARPEFSLCKRMCNLSRTVYEWLPIHKLTTAEVFEVIEEAGQLPFWAYKENTRLSCVFCIMGCETDLAHGARQRPELFKRYCDLEAKTGYTMFNGESLADKVARASSF